MRKLLILSLGMMMLVTNALAGDGEKTKTSNLMIGVVPALGGVTTNIKYNSKDAPNDKFTYNKELGIVVDYEHVINGFIVMPELRWFRGTLSDEDMNFSGFPYKSSVEDINEFGFMEWVGFTINSKRRFQIPLMGGFGASYLTGAPYHNIFFDYGAKVRLKIYITNKFGIFAGGFYEGGVGSSSRGIPSGSDGKYNLRKTNFGGEAGITITL